MKKMELNAGNTIFKKGDPADGLYIVGKGSVGIYFPTNPLEPSVIIFVSTKEFEKKLEGSDMIVRGVMAILSERLRDLQKRR